MTARVDFIRAAWPILVLKPETFGRDLDALRRQLILRLSRRHRHDGRRMEASRGDENSRTSLPIQSGEHPAGGAPVLGNSAMSAGVLWSLGQVQRPLAAISTEGMAMRRAATPSAALRLY